MPKPPSIVRSVKLEREAIRLLAAGEHEVAVLLAQTLLELRVEFEMVDYVNTIDAGAFGAAALDGLPNYNLTGRTLKLLEAMAGVRLEGVYPDEMKALRDHIVRRNRIAHRGAEVTAAEARASIDAVLAVTQVVHVVLYQALGLQDVLDEEERQQREEDGFEDE